MSVSASAAFDFLPLSIDPRMESGDEISLQIIPGFELLGTSASDEEDVSEGMPGTGAMRRMDSLPHVEPCWERTTDTFSVVC